MRFPRLRRASLEDHPDIAALESQYGLGFKSYDEWSYVWTDNPAYHELQDHWPIGWVLENEKGQIVGSHGNFPLLYEFGGKSIIAASGRAWVVDPRYRSYALWLVAPFLEQENANLYFNTTPSLEAAHAFSELGASRVPVGAWDRSVFWITNYHGFVSRWMAKKLSNTSSLTKAFSPPLAAALFLKDKLARAALRFHRNGFDLEFSTAFDDRFDQFWSDLRSQNPGLLLAVRTRKVLEWHFSQTQKQSRLWIWTLMRNSRLIAYSIFFKGHQSGLTHVSLIDFQSLKGNSRLLLPMLSAALEKCAREGVHILKSSGLSFPQSGINQIAPYSRSECWWRYFYKARDQDLAEALSAPNAWNPSQYDGDASIL